jgi:sulfur carrier protein ThiS
MFPVYFLLCYGTERVITLSASATLSNGVSTITVDIDGEDGCDTLGRLLEEYRAEANIPENATIAVNGEPVDPEDFDNYDLDDEDVVTAVKTSGSKG